MVKTTAEEIVNMICKNAKKGFTLVQIAILLRVPFNIPHVKGIIGGKTIRIIKSNNLVGEILRFIINLIFNPIVN